MTAPVVTAAAADGNHETMAFYLPAKYDLATAPTPTDSRVNLRQLAPRVCAVHTFTWTCTTKTAEEKHQALVKWCVNRSLAPSTVVFVSGSQSPPFCCRIGELWHCL